MCCDHLIQTGFTLFCSKLVGDRHMHCGITASGEITAGIVTLHLAGYITPPYRDSISTSTIYVLDSRPHQTRYGLLGSLSPEPLFANDPIPPLHPTPTPVSVCILDYLTQMSLNRLMSTYPWCQRVLTFASAQPLPIIR